MISKWLGLPVLAFVALVSQSAGAATYNPTASGLACVPFESSAYVQPNSPNLPYVLYSYSGVYNGAASGLSTVMCPMNFGNVGSSCDQTFSVSAMSIYINDTNDNAGSDTNFSCEWRATTVTGSYSATSAATTSGLQSPTTLSWSGGNVINGGSTMSSVVSLFAKCDIPYTDSGASSYVRGIAVQLAC